LLSSYDRRGSLELPYNDRRHDVEWHVIFMSLLSCGKLTTEKYKIRDNLMMFRYLEISDAKIVSKGLDKPIGSVSLLPN
jgi:hypothetical protein